MRKLTASWMQEEHTLFADTAARFFEEECVPHEAQWEKDGQVDPALWQKAGALGLLGSGIDEAYGGFGGDYGFDAVIAYQQSYSNTMGWGVLLQSIMKHYVAACGTEEQRQRWLPGLISGETIPAIAMTEPGTGSDLQAVKTRAIKDGNEYVINGSKIFITNGQQASFVVVVAKTDTESKASGISLIVVETDGLDGFSRGRNLNKMGMKAQDTSELFFEDVRVPLTNVLGMEEGKGFYQLMAQLPFERLTIGYWALGAIDRAIDETLDYVKGRKAFGNRLMDLQNTRFKLAECQTKADVTRAFLDSCMEKLNRNELTAADASKAKWWATQVQCEVMDECLQLFGGYGYMSEYPISKLYTDARAQKIYGGANEVMKELIARSMDAGR
ncbi:MAG: acyl-CoA dehydrogenase family protein [Maricaulaceae bacterium]